MGGGVGGGRRDEREVVLEGLAAPRLGHRRRRRLFGGRPLEAAISLTGGVDGIPGAELEVVLRQGAQLPAAQVVRVEDPVRLRLRKVIEQVMKLVMVEILSESWLNND